MDPNRLRYFCAVSETGSVRKAAELCGVSPAALSKAVKLLSMEVGVPLLIPSGRGIALTKEGEQIARRARPLLDQLSQLGSDPSIRTKGDSPVRLGTFEVFSTYFLSEIVRQVPNRKWEIHELGPGDLERAIESDTADIGLTYLPIPSSRLTHHRVTTITMGIYGIRDRFRDAKFSDLPFAIPLHPVTGVPNKVQGLDGWPDHQIARTVRFRVALMESALELCRKGLAVSYLPDFVVRLHNSTLAPAFRLSRFPAPGRLGKSERQAVYLILRREERETGLTKAVSRIVRMACHAH